MDLSNHGIVALVKDREGKFLLLEDARKPMKGFWAPPHGRGDHEDPSEEETVRREVFEETGLSVRPVKKVLTQAADTKVKTVSFWLVEVEGETNISLDEEASNYGWFNVEEALKLNLYPGTKIFFEKLKLGEISL